MLKVTFTFLMLIFLLLYISRGFSCYLGYLPYTCLDVKGFERERMHKKCYVDYVIIKNSTTFYIQVKKSNHANKKKRKRAYICYMVVYTFGLTTKNIQIGDDYFSGREIVVCMLLILNLKIKSICYVKSLIMIN